MAKILSFRASQMPQEPSEQAPMPLEPLEVRIVPYSVDPEARKAFLEGTAKLARMLSEQ